MSGHAIAPSTTLFKQPASNQEVSPLPCDGLFFSSSSLTHVGSQYESDENVADVSESIESSTSSSSSTNVFVERGTNVLLARFHAFDRDEEEEEEEEDPQSSLISASELVESVSSASDRTPLEDPLLEMEDADETDFSVDDQDPDDPDRQCGIRYCSVVLVENLKKRYLSQNALSLSTDVHTICVGEWWD